MILPVLLSTVLGSEEHDHGDEEGGHWWAFYHLEEAGLYQLTIEKHDEAYEAEEYKVLWLDVGEAEWHDFDEALETLEDTTDESNGGTYLDKVYGEEIVGGTFADPWGASEVSAQQNHIETMENSFSTTVFINVAAEGHFALWIEPTPPNANFFFDPDGHAQAQEEGGAVGGHDDSDDHSDEEAEGLEGGSLWGNALAGTLVGALASVVGACVILVVGGFIFIEGLLLWFSSGIIIGVSCLHLIGEAGELNEDGWPHNEALASCLVAGIFIGFFVEEMCKLLAPMCSKSSEQAAGMQAEMTSVSAGKVSAMKDDPEGAGSTLEASEKTGGTGWTALIGDVVHNFFDGFIIAEAFDHCGSGKGWTLAIAILVHELPQEMSDFYVLISSGWSNKKAFLANVVVSLTAFVGVFVYMGLKENLEKHTISFFLALSAGCFIYIGIDIVSNINPAAHKHNPLLLFLCFWAGFFIIYALMQWHPLCSADGTGHEGHDH